MNKNNTQKNLDNHNLEKQIQQMLKNYSNSVKTINKFTKNEESLILTIQNIGITTGERDQNLVLSQNNQLELQAK